MSTYTPLASITLTSAQSSVTFSGYDMTYTDLVLVSSVTCATDSANQRMTVNGDSSSLYSTTRIAGNGSTATSGRYGALAYFLLTGGAINPPSSASAQILITNFMNYSNTTTYKSILVRAGNASGSTYPGVEYNVELYRSTNAISSFTLSTDSANFNSGCTFSLYGIQAGTPKAQGGDIVTTDGTYWYHAFKSSGLFTPSSAISADVLVVAGGGGGGAAGGGGGGGGLRALSAQSFSAQNYGVVVGAGGKGSNNNAVKGGYGSNSSISTITASGGGGGGSNDSPYQYGLSGGSGGGAGRDSNTVATGGTGNAGSYSPVEGYAGGNAANPNAWGGGAGGGGAGAVGGNGISTGAQAGERGGAGGAGANSYNSITITSWLTATNTGVSGYLAGGGGGANVGNNNPASGGSGGGGAGCGSSTTAATSGTRNSGGGGGSDTGTGYTSGSGGSGLVVIRYAV